MQIEELHNYTLLFDVYGKLLSKKQYEVMDKHLNLDLGESELAELFGESRQSIYDAIVKAKKQLLHFEEMCNIVKNHIKSKNLLMECKEILESEDIDKNSLTKKIEDVINNI